MEEEGDPLHAQMLNYPNEVISKVFLHKLQLILNTALWYFKYYADI